MISAFETLMRLLNIHPESMSNQQILIVILACVLIVLFLYGFVIVNYYRDSKKEKKSTKTIHDLNMKNIEERVKKDGGHMTAEIRSEKHDIRLQTSAEEDDAT